MSLVALDGITTLGVAGSSQRDISILDNGACVSNLCGGKANTERENFAV